MKFSVIIPAYNSSAYIKRALDSIECQTFKDYEVIVVCDSCKDDTEAIARSYGARVISVNYEHEGHTRNKGIDVAEGEWLLFMDDDDWWVHDHVLEILNDEADDDTDVIRFAFIWGKNGYTPPGDWYACWNKCWRRSFVGDTRFSDEKDRSDVAWQLWNQAKNPRIKDINTVMYYYDYMREGSVSWQRGC